MHKLLQDLFRKERYRDAFLLARFTYRVGEPYMSDDEYRRFEDIIKGWGWTDLTDHSYDDDPVPYDLLEEFNLNHLNYLDQEVPTELLNSTVGDRTMSIRPLDNYKDAFDFFMATPNEDKVMSTKCNGINTNQTFQREDGDVFKFIGGLTRGRDGNCINVSKNMARITSIHKPIGCSSDKVVIYGESLVDDSVYRLLPRKDGGTFTSSRMAAVSMLRVGEPEDYFSNLKFYAYRASGLDCSTAWETFEELEKMGFTTPPKMFIKAEEVPKEFESFKVWLKEKMDWFYEENKKCDLPADGIVVDVNDNNFIGSTDGHYTSKDCALKFEYWSEKYYVGVIKDIQIKQQRVNASVVVIIEPLVTEDGTTATRITGYNPSILIENNLSVGSKIYFARNSEAISCVLVGDRLKKALDSPELISEGVKTSDSF